MYIKTLRSDQIYQKVAQALPEEKTELFRNEMMAPFMKQWQIQQIPFRAEEANAQVKDNWFGSSTISTSLSTIPSQYSFG